MNKPVTNKNADKQCAHVTYRNTWPRRCYRKGPRYFEDGQWWCGVHKPSAVKARQEKQEQRLADKMSTAEALRAFNQARALLASAVDDMLVRKQIPIKKVPQRLLDAWWAYRKASRLHLRKAVQDMDDDE